MTHTFGLLLLTTMMSVQPPVADVPVIGKVRRPCEATADGPRRPTIVGRDGRFDQRCWQVAGAWGGRGASRVPFHGRRR